MKPRVQTVERALLAFRPGTASSGTGKATMIRA
jgi:hypothetical protein